MKNLFSKNEDLHPFDLVCIRKRLDALELQQFKFELELRCKSTSHFNGKTDLHSEVIKQVAQKINSIEFIPNSVHSITINFTIK